MSKVTKSFGVIALIALAACCTSLLLVDWHLHRYVQVKLECRAVAHAFLVAEKRRTGKWPTSFEGVNRYEGNPRFASLEAIDRLGARLVPMSEPDSQVFRYQLRYEKIGEVSPVFTIDMALLASTTSNGATGSIAMRPSSSSRRKGMICHGRIWLAG